MRTKHTPVQSDYVESVGYNVASRVLELKFRDGSVSAYGDVPFVTYRDLVSAHDMQAFVDTNIKPKFPEIEAS